MAAFLDCWCVGYEGVKEVSSQNMADWYIEYFKSKTLETV